jgi:hypothetical protein
VRLLVTIYDQDNTPAGAQKCTDGQPLTFTFKSPYLISAGQEVTVGVTVFDYELLHSLTMGPKLNAGHLTRKDGKTPLIDVPVVWDVSFIPSNRLLADILAEAVQHGVDFPSHGVDCACMDRLVREIRLQVSKAIPPDGRTTDSDWAKPIHDRITAKARIRSILRMMERNL